MWQIRKPSSADAVPDEAQRQRILEEHRLVTVGDAGAFGGRHDRRAVQRAREAIGHEGRTLLVARQDEADLGRGAQHVQDGQVHRARNTEHMVDAFPAQAIDDRLCTRNH